MIVLTCQSCKYFKPCYKQGECTDTSPICDYYISEQYKADEFMTKALIMQSREKRNNGAIQG